MSSVLLAHLVVHVKLLLLLLLRLLGVLLELSFENVVTRSF